MRVKIEGTSIKPERVVEVLMDVIRRSPKGATLQFFNMYFNIRDRDGMLVDLVDEKGRTIDILTYREDKNKVVLQDPENKKEKSERQLAIVKPFVKKQMPDNLPPSAA